MSSRRLARSLSVLSWVVGAALAGCGSSSDDASSARPDGSDGADAAAEAGPIDSGGDAPDGGATTRLVAGDLAIDVHLDRGTFDVSRRGVLVFGDVEADALVDDGSGRRVVTTRGARLVASGGGSFGCRVGELGLSLALAVEPTGAHATARLDVQNRGAAPIVVLKVSPLVADPASGGVLVLGERPSRHRILENGRFGIFDQTAQLVAGDAPRYGLGFVLPIPLRGDSVSNFTQLVADLDDPSKSLVAGWLSSERSIPTLGIAPAPDDAPLVAGARPFAYAAESAMLFHGKPLASGATIASEVLYLDPLPGDPVEGMERYASALANALGVVAWPKRGPLHDVPGGWNSWSGGSGTGGHGQDIDAALIATSADVQRRELLAFGDRYFQIDDGWQKARGDWTFDATRFPEGGAATARSISDRGFVPGLWIAPFTVGAGSELAATHPDWIAARENSVLGAIGSGEDVLDLSNADARAWVHDLFAGVHEQGFRWVKVDFSYWALLGMPGADPSLTNVEAWRAGWREIRDALGADTFVVGIGMTGLNAGVVDGMRLTLDDGPKWEEPSPDDILATPRSFKGTVRTASRRWFYQNRVWISHADSLFFRSWPDASVPPVTPNESRMLASFVALGGGAVEMGDKLIDVATHPAWIDVLRRLQPAWPDGARPLDVLVRDYPEQWRSHVVADAGTWDVVGVFHWGQNRDLSVEPPRPLDESPRTYHVTCAGECLVYEFWSETFVGRFDGAFDVTLDARTEKLLALRAPTGAPQLLGTNRHVTQGATDMGALSWDAATKTLSGTLLGVVGSDVAPWEHRLAFYVPDGLVPDSAEVDGVAAPSLVGEPSVARLSFSLPAESAGKTVAFHLRFR